MEAVKSGVGRETAHEIIKEHAVATARDLRTGKIRENNLFERLAGDHRLGLDAGKLEHIGREARDHSGAASTQVGRLMRAAMSWRERFPAAASLTPEPIL